MLGDTHIHAGIPTHATQDTSDKVFEVMYEAITL